VTESTFYSGAVEYDGVLHIIAAAAEDSDYVVLATWAFVKAYDVHGFCAHGGFLWVVE
jgi:hypothetical protein